MVRNIIGKIVKTKVPHACCICNKEIPINSIVFNGKEGYNDEHRMNWNKIYICSLECANILFEKKIKHSKTYFSKMLFINLKWEEEYQKKHYKQNKK